MTMPELPDKPYSIAHRGASAYAIENTLLAFRKAAELGADMWEVDIRMSADGQVVVYHDPALPDGRAVAELTWAALNEGMPDGCPQIEEVLLLAAEHGAGIYADIKDLAACLPTLDALRTHGISLAILGAFDAEAVAILRQANCPYPISALVPLGEDPNSYAPHADIIHLCWEHMERPQDMLTPDLFTRAFANGQHIAIWHEEDPSRMAAIRTKPVLGICSDRPEMVNPFRPPVSWPVKTVCHRGANKIAPENTLPAFECIFAGGFSHIELDLHVTSDDHIVVLHDAKLDRTTNGTGLVADHTLSELRELDAGGWFEPFFSGLRIPTLDEVLDLAKRYDGALYLELKTAPPARVWDTVKRAGWQDRCFFWSFNQAFLRELRTHAPEANIMARRQDYPTLAAAIADYDAAIIEFLPDHDPKEIAALRGSTTRAMVQYSGRAPEQFDKLIKLRPDMLNLDYPFDFSRHLASKKTP